MTRVVDRFAIDAIVVQYIRNFNRRVSYEPVINAGRIWHKPDNTLKTGGVGPYPVNSPNMLI
jgi:hypothetical protein